MHEAPVQQMCVYVAFCRQELYIIAIESRLSKPHHRVALVGGRDNGTSVREHRPCLGFYFVNAQIIGQRKKHQTEANDPNSTLRRS